MADTAESARACACDAMPPNGTCCQEVTGFNRQPTFDDWKAMCEGIARAVDVNLEMAAMIASLRAENVRLHNALRRISNERRTWAGDTEYARLMRARKIAREACRG